MSCDAQTLSLFFRDADGDSFGDPHNCMVDCIKPKGYVTNNMDCDDTNAAIHPGAEEICGNSKDDNCNGEIDEAGCVIVCNTAGLLAVTIQPASGAAYTLYVSPMDNSIGGIEWGPSETDIVGLPNITDFNDVVNDLNGASNTAAIVAQLGLNGGMPYAAKQCADLGANGCNDWYLPSLGELKAIYQQLGPAGTNQIPANWYWSSTENGANFAWYQNFFDSHHYFDFKIDNILYFRSRCVRR